MKKYIYVSLLCSIALFFVSCAELKNDIPTSAQPEVQIHTIGFTDTSSSQFHGKLIASEDHSFVRCKTCHGEYLSGENDPKKNCYSIGCHLQGEIHSTGMYLAIRDSVNFHGNLLAKEGYSLTRCKTCHGVDLLGKGNNKKNCYSCHPTAEVHKSGVTTKDSPDFHGNFISGNKWSMAGCQACHGSDFAGGKTGKSCKTCHTQSDGPKACNTCHGDFSNSEHKAPPRGVSSSSAAIGAHSAHLYNNKFGAAVACNECHKVPTNVADAGHIDTLAVRAEVKFEFGSLNKKVLPGSSLNPVPEYDSTSYTCSNIYCHGTMKGGNVSNSPVWNAPTGSIKCGSCHGISDTDPIPNSSPHNINFKYFGDCGSCHKNVVSGTYTFIDKSKHINGIIEQ